MTVGWKAVSLAIVCVLAAYLYGQRPRGEIRTHLEVQYDYVIVGGGTAGCVLANRLSADSDVTVLLLEAGDEETKTPSLEKPALALTHLETDVDWKFKSAPQKYACHGHHENRENLGRGKVLGGTGSINALMYVRGSRHDYDTWAEMGCEGWSYKDVLPYFRKSENNQNEDYRNSDYHGTDGPLFVSDIHRPPLDGVFLKAAEELGHKITDINGPVQEGVAITQATAYHSERMSSATAFLRPVMHRKNLHVATLAHVTKVVFEGLVATGVEFWRNGTLQRVRAGREVILSAGTYGSPHILMLSGIGPRSHLKSFNINVISDLPVGQFYQDHVATESVHIEFEQKVTYSEAEVNSLFAELQYRLFGTGPLASFFAVGSLFMRAPSQPRDHKYPYLQLMLTATSLGWGGPATKNATRDGFLLKDDIYEAISNNIKEQYTAMLMPVLLHPGHRGSLQLASTDPRNPLMIDPNYLSASQDVKILIEGIREARRFVNTTAFRSLGAKLVERRHPSCKEHKYDSDTYWECYVRNGANTHFYHETSTCKMGGWDDQLAVVDPHLRVKGVSNLRVVDASVMPLIPSGNTNAPTVMIAEKAADLIRGEISV